jgi:hypothetical protein
VARDESASGISPELLMNVVYGVLWCQLILEHAPLDESAGRGRTGLLRAVC